jgi:DNA modification methylase
MSYKELLLGCGTNKTKKLYTDKAEWKNLVTVDIDPGVSPDIVHDLDVLPYPFPDQEYDEIHAYDVLEHQGRQGDYKFFFNQFNEFYRILKPKGQMFIISPNFDSRWAWGDPGHCRIIGAEQLIYLDLDKYEQVGSTAMTDYRYLMKCNFKLVAARNLKGTSGFVLQKEDV